MPLHSSSVRQQQHVFPLNLISPRLTVGGTLTDNGKTFFLNANPILHFMKVPSHISAAKKAKALLLAFTVYCFTYLYSFAQDGNAGINEATNKIRSYFATGTTLMYA